MENLEIIELFKHFDVDDTPLYVKNNETGHINRTFEIVCKNRPYILQQINTYVFHDVDLLVNNIVSVTNHLKNKGLATIDLIKAKNGKYYYESGGKAYRLYPAITDVDCHEGLDSPELVIKTGYAFGKLHQDLSDFEAKKLGEIIPHFHDTKMRHYNLLTAIMDDSAHRVNWCKSEIYFINEQKAKMACIVDGLNDGSLPMRITHNDPKVNNILFDKKTGDVKCVIDLDTVMPGSILYDFGDALRSIFTGQNENTTNLSLLKVDLEKYSLYLQGYYSAIKEAITPKEIELLPDSILVLTLELACRFLEDYLRGDKYFKVTFENENLVRARTQIALAKDIIEKMPDLKRITNEIVESAK